MISFQWVLEQETGAIARWKGNKDILFYCVIKQVNE